jgi:hypothetical protein
MEIFGQSFVDNAEKFFHGMYVSAQSQPPLIFDPIVLSVIIALVLYLIGSYIYNLKKPIPMINPLE